ncbi:MAG: oligosaccharide flippase family protein [Parachlamydiaceae bacterium]|nr:oligosaccharide flippase family protein [Parachlamydiaceae bacterium]
MKFKPYLISLLATAFPNALGFLFFPLYAKALGASNYGVVALLEAYQGIASILLFAGMTTAFFVFYSHAEDEQEEQEVFNTATLFGLFILAFAALVALFSKQITALMFHGEAEVSFVAIYAFAVFSDYMLTLINTLLRIKGKISSLAINAILISLVHHGLSFYVVVLLGGDIASFIYIFLVTKTFALMLVVYYTFRLKISMTSLLIERELLYKMLQFGTPLILTALTGWVLLLSDRLFINYYVTTAEVGIYAVAYKFAMGLWIGIVQPFMVVWEPSLFTAFRADPKLGYQKLKRDFSYYLAGIVILFSGFILFIGEILKLLFANSEYSHENSIIYCLVGSYFLMAIGEMWASVCRLNKTSRFAFWVTLAVLTTKVVFNITLIPNYLLIGAAVASVLAEFVSQCVMGSFAVRLSHGEKLFFSLRNWALFSLFCATELLLYVMPEASFLLKSCFFVGLIVVVVSLFVRELRRQKFLHGDTQNAILHETSGAADLLT